MQMQKKTLDIFNFVVTNLMYAIFGGYIACRYIFVGLIFNRFTKFLCFKFHFFEILNIIQFAYLFMCDDVNF